MTLDKAKVFVRVVVAEYRPETAKDILWQRCLADADFYEVMALHGATIMDALIESIGATRH